jgi:hypothetical protein
MKAERGDRVVYNDEAWMVMDFWASPLSGPAPIVIRNIRDPRRQLVVLSTELRPPSSLKHKYLIERLG